ncbi:unnamed protein product [Clavelina lepadiformis]|uniref:Cytochrome P450 n=1 Tax=Clavelina lepadiformis TaxID=159417 RepID=A0ABP0H4D5_CLALP
MLIDAAKSAVLSFYSVLNVWTIALTLAALIYQWWKDPHPRFPPGPKGFPFIGILPYLGKRFEQIVKKWSLDNYGPVMSIRMPRETIVYLNTFEAVNEVFLKQGSISSGRPNIFLFDKVLRGQGIIFKDYSEKFKRQKNFALSTLKHFGMGTKGVDFINDEAECLISYLKTLEGKPVDLRDIFEKSIANIVSRIAMGRRFDFDDEKYNKALKTLRNEFGNERDSALLSLVVLFNFLYLISPMKGAYERFVQSQQHLFDVMDEIIEDHRKHFDKNDIRDFVDAYLYEIRHGAGKTDPGFSNTQLLACVRDIFMAGTETTSGSLYWAVLAILNYPEYYKLLLEEVDRALGGSKRVDMSLKNEMPFTCAFIQEIWRVCSPAPFGAPHKAQSDTEVLGYCIPKGYSIYANIWGVHNDPNTWKDPDKFNPHRHIDTDGKFIRSNKIIPFSVGPRVCLGESLARMEMFLVFIRLLQNFDFTSATNPLPSVLEGRQMLTYTPQTYRVIVKERS